MAVTGGCVGLLLLAMKNHGANMDVVRFGLHALLAIVSNGGVCVGFVRVHVCVCGGGGESEIPPLFPPRATLVSLCA
jgi:hypothetical protein